MRLKYDMRIGVAFAVFLAVLLASGVSTTAQAQGADEDALITLDADSISVNSVLQVLAERSGLNIVTSPEIQSRRISIHLRNTPFSEALNLVVRAAGLGYERVGNSILVADVARLKTETGLVTKVFYLEHADPVEVQKLLQVVSKDVSATPGTNRLVMRASQSLVEQAEDVIAELDKKPGQILLEARLIEVNTTSLLEVGIDWEEITKWTTVITEGNRDASRQGQLPQESDFIKFDETLDGYRQLAAFEISIDALITDGHARLLSNSTLVTLDNEPAEIFAGETVPVVITSLQSPGQAGGTFQTVQLEKIDVGVKLGITPRISGDGLITVLVQPEVSRIVAFVGPDDDLPQTSTRRARTLVRVRDGETIYIGGLLTEETRRSVKKVPILGQIPILGYLFQHNREDKVRLDLLIEITPRIVGDEGTAVPSGPEIGLPEEGEGQ